MVALPTNATHTLIGASASETGRRKQNEDSVGFGLTDDGAFAIVADGMGGGLDGKRFSERAVEVLSERLRAAPMRDRGELERGIAQVTREVNRLRQTNPAYHVSGTTLVAAVFQQHEQHTDVVIANIGDSRAYKIPASGPAEQLTHDHTYAEHLIRTGIDADEAYQHPQALRLTHALGDALDLEQVPHLYTPEPVRLVPGEFLVLCTDGVCKHLSNEQIATLARSQPTEQAVNELVRAATAAGSKDNVSAIIVGYTQAKPKSSLLMPIMAVVALLLISLGGLSLWYRSAGAQAPGAIPGVAATVTPIPTVATALPATSTPAVVGPETSTPAPSVTLTPTNTPTNTPTATNTPLPTNTPTPQPVLANTTTPTLTVTPTAPTTENAGDAGSEQNAPSPTPEPPQTEPSEPVTDPTVAQSTVPGEATPDPNIPPPAPPTPTFTPVPTPIPPTPEGNLNQPAPLPTP
jgi:serine/threonine protein phosphatase PrpC